MEKQASAAELEKQRKEAGSFEQFKRGQVIALRVKNPGMSVKERLRSAWLAVKP